MLSLSSISAIDITSLSLANLCLLIKALIDADYTEQEVEKVLKTINTEAFKVFEKEEYGTTFNEEL